jgi:RimJ/RimL family protein N-acetyltransferase
VSVRLRPWRPTDASDIAVMTDDEQVRHWSDLSSDLHGWLEREMAGLRGPSRAICADGDDRALGRVALRLPEHASAAVRCDAMREADQPAGELSYWVLPAARGRGIATAGVEVFMATIVAETGIRSVVLDIEDANPPSRRVAERLGAERRAPARVVVDRTGIPRTLIVFVITVGDNSRPRT